VLRAGLEPAVSWLRTKRDIRYSNGARARRPRFELGTIRVETGRAIRYASGARSGPSGNRMGRGQRVRQDSNLQGRGSPGFKPGSVTRSDCAPVKRRGRDSNSQGRSSTAFGAGPVAHRVASPWRKVHGSNVCRRTWPPVSSGAPCLSVNLPCKESGRLERHAGARTR
jgi:hypothetical protein